MLRIKHRTCFNLLLAPGEEWRARAPLILSSRSRARHSRADQDERPDR